ncbi:MFS transporter (plasmid) [Clavibacter capsici]|uniref:MFS transporter n=1 Tax=Clavibacter capsici TaxID=1874630 RepID=A0AAE7CDL8_9MICO|nr:MFS transporter [Clavibacter capsici]QIS43518.1 MFS transporter [Clavibacter capsici]QIS46436.1 MFS transporter [Clavibacter capsici]
MALASSRVVAAISQTAVPIILTLGPREGGLNADALAQALSALVIAQLAMLPVGGVALDRLNRRAYIILVQCATAVAYALFGVSFTLQPPNDTMYVMVAVIMGGLAGLNGPSTQSIIPQLVKHEHLQASLSSLRAVLTPVAVLAPMISAFWISQWPYQTLLVALAILNIFSTVFLTQLPQLKHLSERRSHQRQALKSHPLLSPWFATTQLSSILLIALSAGFYQLSGPRIVSADPVLGSNAWAFILGGFGLGNLVGVLRHRRKKLKAAGSTPFLFLSGRAAPIIALGLYASGGVFLTAPSAALAGFAVGAWAVHYYNEIQIRIPQGKLGSALAVDAFISLAAMPLGYQAAALLADNFDTETLQIAAGLGTLLISGFAWLALRCLERPLINTTRASLLRRTRVCDSAG